MSAIELLQPPYTSVRRCLGTPPEVHTIILYPVEHGFLTLRFGQQKNRFVLSLQGSKQDLPGSLGRWMVCARRCNMCYARLSLPANGKHVSHRVSLFCVCCLVKEKEEKKHVNRGSSGILDWKQCFVQQHKQLKAISPHLIGCSCLRARSIIEAVLLRHVCVCCNVNR